MNSDHSIILNSLFFVVGGLFAAMEYLRPDRTIDRKREFKKDIVAFFVLILSGVLLSAPLIKLFHSWSFIQFQAQSTFQTYFKVIAATIVLDFANYWIHYWMHKSNAYWKAHVFHHKVEELYWFSGLRASFTHYASFIFSRTIVGVFLFDLSSYEMLIYLIFGYTTNFYQHTNARVGHKFIEWILVTPRVHRLHHSTQGRRMKNLGTIFSFWDRMFGTWLDPETYEKEYELGVKPNSEKIDFKELLGI